MLSQSGKNMDVQEMHDAYEDNEPLEQYDE